MTHVVLTGPTASGKTDLALAVARRLPDLEIVNADSRQTLAGLRTATCAPAPEILAEVPHHLVAYRRPGHPPTAAEWLEDATAAIRAIEAREHVALVVGGTGLYLRALLFGLDDTGPAPDPVVRKQRTAAAVTAAGAESLRDELRARDPDAAAQVDLANPRRVIRALEILDATGGPLGAVWRQERAVPRFPGVILTVPRDELRERIERRAAAMFATGAIQQESAGALADGIGEAELAASGIGYQEALALAAGEMSASEAAARTAERTRRYAKTQRTFLRSLAGLHPIGGESGRDILIALLTS